MVRQTVALIIPTYNRAKWLQLALASVFNQTRKPDETIVVNDGSTDGTLDALSAYGSQITVISRTNGGRSAARNAGLEASHAELIAFLDDDDLLPPSSIEARAAYLEQHPDVDVVYGDAIAVDASGAPLGPLKRVNGAQPTGYVLAEIARRNLAPIHAYMFRRSCLQDTGLFDVNLTSAEDWDFWIRMAARHRFGHIADVLAYYRFPPGMAEMSSYAGRTELALRGLKVQKRVFDMPEFQALPAAEQALIYEYHALWNIRAGQIDETRRFLDRAIRAAPKARRAYLLLALVTVFRLPLQWSLRTRLAQRLVERRTLV